MWMTSEKMKHKGWLNAHTCSRHMFLNVRHVISFHLSVKASESLANNTHVSHTQQRAWRHSVIYGCLLETSWWAHRQSQDHATKVSHLVSVPICHHSEGRRPSTPSSIHTHGTSFHTQHEEIYSRVLLPVWVKKKKNCYCAKEHLHCHSLIHVSAIVHIICWRADPKEGAVSGKTPKQYFMPVKRY